MDPLGSILLHELRFWTSWGQWTALRRSLAMYASLPNKDRLWLASMRDEPACMYVAGASLLKMIASPTNKRVETWIKYLDSSAAALAALGLATDPVNRDWVPPPKPIESVTAAIRHLGGQEAHLQIARFGAGSIGSFLRLFRAQPQTARDPLARLGEPLGIAVPPPNAPHAQVLHALVQIHDRIPVIATVDAEPAERSLTPDQVGGLIRSVIQIYGPDPDSFRRGLLAHIPERLATNNPSGIRPHLRMLLDHNIVLPPYIFRGAPPDFVSHVQQLAAQPSSRARAEAILAAVRGPALDDPECPHISDDCRALPARGDHPIDPDQPIHAAIDDLNITCPRCANPVVSLLDLRLDTPHLASFAARLPAAARASGCRRLRIAACHNCLDHGMRTLAALSPAGDPIPGSIRIFDPDSEEEYAPGPTAPVRLKPDFLDEWKPDSLRFDPTPRLPDAPDACTLGHPGSSHLGGLPDWTRTPNTPTAQVAASPCPSSPTSPRANSKPQTWTCSCIGVLSARGPPWCRSSRERWPPPA